MAKKPSSIKELSKWATGNGIMVYQSKMWFTAKSLNRGGEVFGHTRYSALRAAYKAWGSK